MQDRLDRQPEAMQLRRQTVEHPFATLKAIRKSGCQNVLLLCSCQRSGSPAPLAWAMSTSPADD